MYKAKKKVAFSWWGDWTLIWIFGGFALTYFIFVTHEFLHPIHWLISFLGGIVGYGIGLFVDTGLPAVVRFVRRSSERMILKSDSKKKQRGKTR